MSIKNANKMFEEKDFKNALELYENIVKRHPSLEKILRYNIKQCQLFVDKTEVHIDNKNVKAVDKTFLSVELDTYIKSQSVPSYNDIIELMKSLDDKNFNIDALFRCGCSSPFQIDLLRHIRKSLVAKKLKSKLYEVEFGLNLATVIRLATEKEYWLTNRVKFKKKYKYFYDADERLNNLLDNFSAIKNSLNNFKTKTTIRKKTSNSIIQNESIAFGTILLNEQKFIAKSLFHHYDFFDKWVLVEGTCLGYPTRKVTDLGFSKDLTSKMIKVFPDPKNKIMYIPYGWTVQEGEDAKSELRNRYLRYIDEDYLVVIDADEFYLKNDLVEAFSKFGDKNIYGITLPQVHFWKSTKQYITGEYYDISHTRLYKNIVGMKYIHNHNFPEINGKYIHELGHYKYKRTQIKKGEGYIFEEPKCFHMGFAKDYDDMKDKSDYYVNRGEDETRKTTTASRAAWFTDELPDKCRVKQWSGELPEVLKEVK